MPNTVDNLKEAFAGESQAFQKYSAFAKAAEKDGMPNIARLFRTTAQAERIHAAGYPILALRQPMLFPARSLPGSRRLSGLGTPDLAGGAGFYAVWSSRPSFPRSSVTVHSSGHDPSADSPPVFRGQ